MITCNCGEIFLLEAILPSLVGKPDSVIKKAEICGWRKINNNWVCPKCNGIIIDESKEKCKCIACEHGMDVLKAMEEKSLKNMGWYAHIILNDHNCPFNYNIHTHGVRENFQHLDLQICFPLDPKNAHTILTNIINQIKSGKKYEIGKPIIDNYVLKDNYPFLFVKTKENSRDVFRIILCDEKKSLDRETMKYNEQWKNIYKE